MSKYPMFKYKCVIENCRDSFSNHLELREHLIYFHNCYEATHICPEPNCRQKFNSLKKLNAHEKTHGEYLCSICNEKFLLEKYLRKHLNIHKKDRETFKCQSCDSVFYYKANLKAHVKVKHEKRMFECIYCGKSLSSKQKLTQHTELFHNNEEITVVDEEDCEINQDIVLKLDDLEKGENTNQNVIEKSMDSQPLILSPQSAGEDQFKMLENATKLSNNVDQVVHSSMPSSPTFSYENYESSGVGVTSPMPTLNQMKSVDFNFNDENLDFLDDIDLGSEDCVVVL